MLTENISPNQNPQLINHDVRFHHSLCWKAIFAGVVTAIGIHLLLLCLGAGIGLATFSPTTDTNPAENFSTGTAVAWSVCALISLYVGGWVAGCFSAGPKTGTLHGMIVWSVTMIITFGLVATGGGLALGGVVKALGNGLGMTGKAAVSSAAGLAKGDMQGSNQLGSFVKEAVKSSPTNTTPGMAERGQREITFAAGKLFAPGNDINSAEAQAGVVQALTNYAGLSEADAKKMEAEWMNSYKSLKTQIDEAKDKADEKARVEADKAARHLAKAATVAFFAFLVGLLVTICGGICGAKKMYRHTSLGMSSV